jgi:hypothetical protein
MVVSACFTVPVAAPRGLPLDAALLGRWECTSVETESADHAQLYVLRFDQQQYYAEWREGDKVDRYRAYPVRARGVTFLGVGDLGPSSLWPWSAVLYSVREGGALSLQLPAKRILDMSDEKAAIQELKAKADRPDTWQSLARCERPKNGA